MFARVDEVSSLDDGSLYLRVSVWATKARFERGLPADLANDFIFDIQPTGQRAVLDADGEPTGEFETVEVDVRAFVRGHVVDWLKRAAANRWAGDRTLRRVRRSQADPRGLRARAAAMAGERVET